MHTDHGAERECRVSVIIPTYQAGASLTELLQRLWTQTLKPLEIIIVDSSSSDGTADRARQAGAVVFSVEQQEFDHGGTRNHAASFAKGDVLVFMTQDAMPVDETMLQALVKPLRDDRVGCAYGRQIARPDANFLEKTSRAYNYPPEPIRKDESDIPKLGLKTFFCSNACAAIRKETFERMGRFAFPVIFNEDLFLAAQCVLSGMAIEYVPDARVWHSHNYSVTQVFRRFFDNGVSMRRNEWIRPYAAVNKEGFQLVAYQMRELTRTGRWHLMFRLAAETMAKYAGYQLGKRYDKLSPKMCRRFSMHRQIWGKLQSQRSGQAPSYRAEG